MVREIRTLWNQANYGINVLKSDWYHLLFRLQDLFVRESMQFYCDQNLSYIPLPVTTGAVSSPMGLGSDSLPVQVILGGTPVYLADSMQFLLEYATRMADRGAFYLMPSFRGEPTDQRHLSQFFHSEAEIKGGLEDVLTMVELYITHLSQCILNHLADDVKFYAGTIEHIEYCAAGSNIPRISWIDAVSLLKKVPGTLDMLSEGILSINQNGERYLMNQFGGFVWVTHFDQRIVPFYQANCGGYALNADLLMGIGETVGAGERHTTSHEVLNALHEHNVTMSSYDWYVQMKSEFPLRTSGFGMGMERFLLWVLKHNDIRDCQIVSRIDGSQMMP